MDIMMLAEISGPLNKRDNDRFKYIANLLTEEGQDVELVVGDFDHHKKCKHEKYLDDFPFRVTVLEEPGYKKNISLKRIMSYRRFSTNLKKYLKERRKPDVIYCAVPPLESANVMAKYAKKNNIRFVIDIQDLWPDGFYTFFGNHMWVKMALFPMRAYANRIYAASDHILAVSDTYGIRGTKQRKQNYTSVFLGTDLKDFDRYCENNNVELKNKFKLVYVGNCGYSYTLDRFIEAISLCKNKDKMALYVLGDGPLKNDYQTQCEKLGVDGVFMGKLDYPTMVKYLVKCDVALNPIKDNAAASIINKVGDYAAAQLPVINSQDSKEYRELVEKYHIGINCTNCDLNSISEAIEGLYQNEELRTFMGKSNRAVAEQFFDRNRTYLEIAKVLTES